MAAKAEWAVSPWIEMLPINVVLGSNQCLLYPRKRTFGSVIGMSALCRYCCKSILSIPARKIDSKSRSNA